MNSGNEPCEKMGGWIDKKRKFHAHGSQYAEGCVAAQMRYGFDPKQKHPDFVRGYDELTEKLYPLHKGWDGDRRGYYH